MGPNFLLLASAHLDFLETSPSAKKNTPLCLTLPQPSRSLELWRGCRFGRRPVWGVTTSIPHGYICQSLLPPVCSCSDLCGCIGGGQSERRPPFYSDSCAYDTVVGFGPVYLRSVISESLKRLGQFRGDKWWTGRTADVGTQTFQHDGLNWGWSPSRTVHPVAAPPRLAPDHLFSASRSFSRAARPHEPLYYSHQNKW